MSSSSRPPAQGRSASALPPEPVDVLTVTEHLRSRGKLDDVGGAAAVDALAGAVPAAGNARRYAQIVRDHALMRRLLTTTYEIQAGVHGTVILELTIGEDGAVSNVRVLRSIPLLDAAAVDAARKWRYTPTLLNGRAVSIILTATVPFE